MDYIVRGSTVTAFLPWNHYFRFRKQWHNQSQSGGCEEGILFVAKSR